MHMAQRQRAQADTVRNLPAISDEDAREKLSTRLNQLAGQHRFTFTHVTIRRQKTRWGSCTSRGAISLNIALARLPQELMDYVILHELLHTRIRGHGSQFWTELERLDPQAFDHHRRLRCYDPTMMVVGIEAQSERR